LVELTEKELVDLLDDDAVAFVEQVRYILRTYI
jgi:hypothetical protein